MALPGETPEVDVIIAVHSAERPVDRAVRSVLEGTPSADSGGPALRVSVVCHDIETSVIAERLGSLVADARLRLLEHRDGVRSPSGPFNAGLDAATAEWVSIMGSDDELEPGALVSWLHRARSTGSSVVLPPIVRRGRDGRDVVVPTPPGRPRRTERLDGVRDRLAYRSAPLGLLRRALIGQLRFPAGLPQGEDVLFSAQLWYSGAAIALAVGGLYIVHDDAGDRVTLAPRPLAQSLAFVTELLDDRWFRAQPLAVRRALAAKLLRINVLGEFVNRPAPESWSTGERSWLATLVAEIDRVAAGVLPTLSVADRRVLDALDPGTGVDVVELLLRARARRRFGTPKTLVTPSARFVFGREAPLRFMISSVAARRCRSAR